MNGIRLNIGWIVATPEEGSDALMAALEKDLRMPLHEKLIDGPVRFLGLTTVAMSEDVRFAISAQTLCSAPHEMDRGLKPDGYRTVKDLREPTFWGEQALNWVRTIEPEACISWGLFLEEC